jgi:hypothetical protein
MYLRKIRFSKLCERKFTGPESHYALSAGTGPYPERSNQPEECAANSTITNQVRTDFKPFEERKSHLATPLLMK